jgi:hypothetical protein
VFSPRFRFLFFNATATSPATAPRTRTSAAHAQTPTERTTATPTRLSDVSVVEATITPAGAEIARNSANAATTSALSIQRTHFPTSPLAKPGPTPYSHPKQHHMKGQPQYPHLKQNPTVFPHPHAFARPHSPQPSLQQNPGPTQQFPQQNHAPPLKPPKPPRPSSRHRNSSPTSTNSPCSQQTTSTSTPTTVATTIRTTKTTPRPHHTPLYGSHHPQRLHRRPAI